MIHLECPTCDISRSEDTGVGMLGKGQELCACYTCKRFVMKKVNFLMEKEGVQLRCPYCRREVKPIEDGDSCPECGSEIKIEVIGLWD